MSKFDELIEKYRESGDEVAIHMPSVGFIRAQIEKFKDDLVVVKPANPSEPGAKFACHKNNIVFLVKED